MKQVDSIFYVHSQKSIAESLFKEACKDKGIEPSEKAVFDSGYCGYEIELKGYWTEDGKFYVTHLFNAKLERPMQI